VRWRDRWQCSDGEGAAGLASSAPMAHGEHSGQGEEAADSPWRCDDSEAVEWVGTAALQWWWGATAITGGLGQLWHHPWNRREVSISSIKRILRSVGAHRTGEEMTVLGPKSGEERRLRQPRSRQRVAWDGGGGDGMLGHGREGVMGTRGEGERLAAFEPGRRKNGESRGRARHAFERSERRSNGRCDGGL
jgi:hypothetical protein